MLNIERRYEYAISPHVHCTRIFFYGNIVVQYNTMKHPCDGHRRGN